MDRSGSASVAGTTGSSDFPTRNAFQPGFGGENVFPSNDFVTKFDSSGNVVYSTHLPNATIDGLAVDQVGNTYVTGDAGEGFPTTPNAEQPNLAPPVSPGLETTDGFVTKLGSGGNAVYSTYFGGEGKEDFFDIAVDALENAYVTAGVGSTTFPTRNSIQPPDNMRGRDVGVAKFDPEGNLVYSTLLGGMRQDEGVQIDADGTGNAYVAGTTRSPEFPTRNAFDSIGSGPERNLELFATKLSRCIDIDNDGSADDDGDGLCDNWESEGVDVDGDGNSEFNLHQAPYNADPERKDLFLEIDYMRQGPGEPRSHQPRQNALQNVKSAFSNAPVSNPDGNPDGINLHLRVDTPGNNVPESQAINHRNVLNYEGVRGADFDDVKDRHFGAPGDSDETSLARRLTHRYAIFAHRIAPGDRTSGRAEGIPGNDFIVTLGRGPNVGNTVGQQSTLMHEFGHTLGLRHGGGDDRNCKPNYLSVMSYSLQFPTTIPGRPLDYSRRQLPTLNESNLSEPVGVQSPVRRRTVYDSGVNKQYIRNAAGEIVGTRNSNRQIGRADRPIDWNSDTDMNDRGVSRDINWIDAEGCLGDADDDGNPDGKTKLRGHDDWANLVYNFRNVPAFADGVHPTPPGVQEQPVRESPPLLEVEINVSSVDVGSSSRVMVNVTDADNGTAVPNATVNVTGAGVDVSDRTTDSNGTATFSLNPDETGDITVRATKPGLLPGQTTVSVSRGPGTSNPFFDSNGNPRPRQEVIDRIVQWNLNGEINGTSFMRQEIINFVVNWNLAS